MIDIGILLGIIGVLFAFQKPRDLVTNFFEKIVLRSNPAVVENWLEQINQKFKGEVQIFCQTDVEPIVDIDGEYQLTDSQKIRAQEHRDSLRLKGCVNDMHAILSTAPNWDSSPVHVRVKTIDYAGIIALREDGIMPEILSAGAFLLSSEMKKVLLHRRGANVATYSNALHIFGGGYMPPSQGQGKDDGKKLRRTAYREIHEETGLGVSTSAKVPMIFAKELSTGFIQFVYLGFNLKIGPDFDASGNWEGHIEAFSYEALPALLDRADWVPSGKAHTLAWLALGSFGCDQKQRFGRKKSNQVFQDYMKVSSQIK